MGENLWPTFSRLSLETIFPFLGQNVKRIFLAPEYTGITRPACTPQGNLQSAAEQTR